MSFTGLYALFVLKSVLLFNALILLSRYVQQTKSPPADEEFELLLAEKKKLENDFEAKKHELAETETRIQGIEEKLRKTEDTLQAKLTELQNLQKQAAPAAPGTPGAAS